MKTLPILISINSSAHRDDDKDEAIALLTSGLMTIRDDSYLIAYEETLDESMPPQQVEITVTKDSVSMIRGGAYETSMVFIKGQRFEGQYRTPFGDMELAVYCTRLKNELTAEGGDLMFSYQLDLNGYFAAMHEMELKITLQNEHSA